MGRTIITTCGTSLFTSSCWQNYGLPSITEAAQKGWQELLDARLTCEETLRDAMGKDPSGDALVGAFDPGKWHENYLRDLPAELASLFAIGNYFKKNETPLTSEDTLTLFHADNPEAEFCASVLQKVLSKNNFLGVTLDDYPWKKKGLTLTQPYFKQLMALWEDITERYRDVGHVYFNLTGGYKAIIMLFTCMAYSKGSPDHSIFYLNEEKGSEISHLCFPNDWALGKDQYRPLKPSERPIVVSEYGPDGHMLQD